MSCSSCGAQTVCTQNGSSGVLAPFGAAGQELWDELVDDDRAYQVFSNNTGQGRRWPFVRWHSHAQKHKESAEIRESYRSGNIVAIFRQGENRYHCIVTLQDHIYGDYIVEKNEFGQWHEITAFKRSKSWVDVLEWLHKKTDVMPYLGALPA